MIWKKRPTETDVAALSSKIGTVPSGKTVEGQITELNSNMPKKTGTKTYSISQGTSVGDHSELNIGNAKTFFKLSNNNTIVGVFVTNVSSSFGSTFNHYIASDGNLYMRIDHAFTAGANAWVQFYALYTER